MAFERDPDRLITVTHLEYYSLEKYLGHLTFAEGLTKIEFKGNRIVSESQKQEEQSRSRFKLDNINITNKASDTVNIKTILGVMLGPDSATFREYIRRQFRNKTV